MLVLAGISTRAQYYLRGEIKDETQKPLPNVRMMLHSTGYIYYSGTTGGFGITSSQIIDTATLDLEGFKSQTVAIDSRKENSITLKPTIRKGNNQEMRLMSVTRDLKGEEKTSRVLTGETYSTLRENDFMAAGKFPATDFAVNTDKASYSNIRRFLNMGNTVPPDAVRIEEMLNYFDLNYEEPEPGAVFKMETRLSECPWNPKNQLFFIKASAKKLNLENIPPSNLVFLIDVSGSMDMPNRLPLLKSAFKLMVNNLRAIDTVSIVVYGGTVGVWLPPTSGAEKVKIHKAIEELEAGGATEGESGIRSAYRLAQSKFIPNGNNRVILATDGDFNVGQTSEEGLDRLISSQKQLGIYLTCLGVGMGNYKDSKLEVLAKKGNGNFAYLDDEKEAEKVLVKELTQTMYAVADDALLHVKFNADAVKNYRLIGFDNKVTAISDSSSVLEGGEVGSGHTLMAIFEIELPEEGQDSSAKLADIELTCRLPNDTKRLNYYLSTQANPAKFSSLPDAYRFAAGITLFGSLLKESRFTKQAGWNDVQNIVQPIIQPDNYLQGEFLVLLEKAKKIYYKGKSSRLRNIFK
ncbi:vWA domain-containing protein [Flavihumibacter profundi]|uniref:vWA domain-containing protein n=1 Tax=Flavihumibacter profundi TaxID=2716883 RepID=UPI001CC3D0BB|nr:VWA domain-containing protein [Flavihumibacter profundi]MBZ5859263.1 VWA domain-containing protein [Flavihumibacter profundi]